MVSFVPDLSQLPFLPSCFFLLERSLVPCTSSPPFSSFPAQNLFGPWTVWAKNETSVYPPAFLWPNPSLPSTHGGKTVLKWHQSTEKPECLESKLILQTPNQSTKIAASIYPPAARPLGSLMVHFTLSPPRGRGWWEERTRLTPLSSSILSCSFLK